MPSRPYPYPPVQVFDPTVFTWGAYLWANTLADMAAVRLPVVTQYGTAAADAVAEAASLRGVGEISRSVDGGGFGRSEDGTEGDQAAAAASAAARAARAAAAAAADRVAHVHAWIPGLPPPIDCGRQSYAYVCDGMVSMRTGDGGAGGSRDEVLPPCLPPGDAAGDDLGNAALIMRFGIAVPNNPNDVVMVETAGAGGSPALFLRATQLCADAVVAACGGDSGQAAALLEAKRQGLAGQGAAVAGVSDSDPTLAIARTYLESQVAVLDALLAMVAEGV